MEGKTALLIIDIQNDYFKNGDMELVRAEEAAQNAAILLSAFREKKLPILFVQHIASEQASFFRPNTEGVEINKSITPKAEEPIFKKNYPNSFRETELLSYLKKHNISKLVICGMMTHMCVDTTVRAAYDLGFENLMIGDACATKDLEFGGEIVAAKEVQISYLAGIHGTFAQVISTEEYIQN